MLVTFYGGRGSIATPDPRTIRYGGNTSCVYANIGKKDGSDDYLYAEFNLCDF